MLSFFHCLLRSIWSQAWQFLWGLMKVNASSDRCSGKCFNPPVLIPHTMASRDFNGSCYDIVCDGPSPCTQCLLPMFGPWKCCVYIHSNPQDPITGLSESLNRPPSPWKWCTIVRASDGNFWFIKNKKDLIQCRKTASESMLKSARLQERRARFWTMNITRILLSREKGRKEGIFRRPTFEGCQSRI